MVLVNSAGKPDEGRCIAKRNQKGRQRCYMDKSAKISFFKTFHHHHVFVQTGGKKFKRNEYWKGFSWTPFFEKLSCDVDTEIDRYTLIKGRRFSPLLSAIL